MKKNKKPVELRGRGDWGMVKPVTKVIPNKKKNRKEKYKGKYEEQEENEYTRQTRNEMRDAAFHFVPARFGLLYN